MGAAKSKVSSDVILSCGLYGITPPLVPHHFDPESLDALFRQGILQSLLVRFAGPEFAFAAPLVASAQTHGVAVLVADDANLMTALFADGLHVDAGAGLSLKDFKALRQKYGYNLGVGGLALRHDALEFAEAGADYVMFGRYGHDDGEDEDAAVHGSGADAVEALLSWWAPLVTTPSVACAHTLEEASRWRALGADFIGYEIDVRAPGRAQILLQNLDGILRG